MQWYLVRKIEIPFNTVIFFTYAWVKEYTKFCAEEFRMSPCTVADWKSWMREVCASSVLRIAVVIGDLGENVDVDESCSCL